MISSVILKYKDYFFTDCKQFNQKQYLEAYLGVIHFYELRENIYELRENIYFLNRQIRFCFLHLKYNYEEDISGRVFVCSLIIGNNFKE